MLDADATVPHELVHPSFVATPLTTAHAALDHAAYTASPDVIRLHSDGRWPVDGFTVEDDRAQATAHETDHRARRAFTFLLLDPTRGASLGCLYLNPLHAYLRRAGANARTRSALPPRAAMVTFWVRQDHQHTRLSADVAEAVHTWLTDDWPLEAHLFRVLPAEHSSVAALDRLPLSRVRLHLTEDRRPYLWYGALRTVVRRSDQAGWPA